ncbi:MAG: hypothetical protein NT040_05670 [Bacteroidetes bacterium]|nr:hypothetical protein [Bacteroidota bacterium]
MMTAISEILSDKLIKPGAKTGLLSKMILAGDLGVEQLLQFASTAKDPSLATCIEALEFVSASQPGLITKTCFEFVTGQLKSKAPRVRWESARVVANTAFLYPARLDAAITNLLANTEHTGTVVRWSAAGALAAILKLKTSRNTGLIPAVEAIMEREEKNSIRKIYAAALKKTV